MLTMFQICVSRDSLSPDEFSGEVWTNDPPALGDLISLGSENRWQVMKVELFKGKSEAVAVAYLNLASRPVLPEAEWDCQRLEREYGFGGDRLAIHLDDDRKPIYSTLYFHNEQPKIGEQIFTSAVPVPGHPTLMQEVPPYYQIEEIEDFHPEQSFFKSLHVCQCKAVELVAA